MNWLTKFSLLIFLCTNQMQILSAADKLPVVVAVITKSLGSGPETNVDLGLIRVSETNKLRLRLENRTAQAIAFDNITKGCKCVELASSRGKIEPGETLTIGFTQTLDSKPPALEGGGMIAFRKGDEHVFQMNYVYQVKSYVGFASNLVLATIGRDDSSRKVELRIPMVIGIDVEDSDFELSINGISGDFSYVIDRKSGQAIGKLTLAENENTDRLYGAIELVDLRGGQIASAPLAVEFEKSLKVFPGFLKFSQDSLDESLTAKVYVRPIDPTEIDVTCTVSARLGDMTLKCSPRKLGNRIFGVSIEMSPAQLKAWKSLEVEDNEAAKSRRVSLSVRYGPSQIVKSVPFSILEYQP